jgi:osmotically-inducible protein OsmY
MRRIFAVAATALFLAVALQPAEAPKKTEARAAARPPWKDTELRKAVEARLARSAIASDHFKVTVTDGVVHITGTTNVMQHKGVATRLAHSVGAKDVRNEIEVSKAARRKAAEQLTRGRKSADAEQDEADHEPPAGNRITEMEAGRGARPVARDRSRR